MKTVVVQGDGVVSVALPELGGKTVLQTAKTPQLDFLASRSEFGLLALPTEEYPLSGAVTQLALLGYEPSKYYSGLAPFEAASLGVLLDRQDMAYLCQFVTLDAPGGRNDHKRLGPHLILGDEEAGGIETDEARELIDTMNDHLASEAVQFYSGDKHRHLMVWIGNTARCGCGNPRIVQGQSIAPFLPSGKGADFLLELMEASRVLLRDHPVNQEREEAGLKPANCLWLWGPGKAMDLPKWTDRWHATGITISPASVHRGIGMCAGLDVLNPADDEQFEAHDFSIYVKLCRQALEKRDYVYLQVPMPCIGPVATTQDIVGAVEAFDEQVIGPLLESSHEGEDYRLLVVCTHPGKETDTSPIPQPVFAYCRKEGMRNAISSTSFHEADAAQGTLRNATQFTSRMLVH